MTPFEGERQHPEKYKAETKELCRSLRAGLINGAEMVHAKPIPFARLVEIPVFKTAYFKDLTARKDIGRFVKHDAGNVAAALSFLEMLVATSKKLVETPDTLEHADKRAQLADRRELLTDNIEQKLERYMFIMQDVLSRLEQEVGGTLEKEPFVDVPPERLVDLLVADIGRFAASSKRISMRVETQFPPEKSKHISGDKVGIVYNSVRNMLVNAFKEGVQATEVTLVCNVTDSHCTIEVWDNGLGMPPDRLDPTSEETFIFNTGVTHNEGKEKGKGKGLGLADVARRLQAHDIDITVASNGTVYAEREAMIEDIPERGTVFRIDVPLTP